MIYAKLTEMVVCVYCITDVIIFNIYTDIKGAKYLCIVITEDDQEIGEPVYFKWNNIPPSIYTIYKYAKFYSKTIFDENTNTYTIYGTHIGRKNEKEYVLAKLTTEHYNSPLSFVCNDTTSYYNKECYETLVDNMIDVKNLPDSFKRGSIILNGG